MKIIYSGSWGALALRGVLAVLFGVLALLVPGVTLQTLVLFFGAYALIDGIFSIAAGLRTHPQEGQRRHWWALLVEGAAGIFAGLVTFGWPGITLLTLLALVAIWALATGLFEIIAAVYLRISLKNELFLLLCGFLSMLLGVLVILRPGLSALALTELLGIYAVLFGALLFALSLRLRSLEREITHDLQPPLGHPV